MLMTGRGLPQGRSRALCSNKLQVSRATGAVQLKMPVTRFLRSSTREKLQAAFATRDVILRSDGRIRYLRLTTRTQIAAIAILGVLGISAVTASIGMGVQQLSI